MSMAPFKNRITVYLFDITTIGPPSSPLNIDTIDRSLSETHMHTRRRDNLRDRHGAVTSIPQLAIRQAGLEERQEEVVRREQSVPAKGARAERGKLGTDTTTTLRASSYGFSLVVIGGRGRVVRRRVRR